MSALFAAPVICAEMPAPPPPVTMLPLVLIVTLPLVDAAVCCAKIPAPTPPVMLPDPPMNMLPVLDDTAFTALPNTLLTLPFSVIDVLPVPPTMLVLIPLPFVVDWTSAPE